MQPPEVRILKHLLTLEDPQRLRAELAAAFEPGPELATEQQDFLSTCTPHLCLSCCPHAPDAPLCLGCRPPAHWCGQQIWNHPELLRRQPQMIQARVIWPQTMRCPSWRLWVLMTSRLSGILARQCSD